MYTLYFFSFSRGKNLTRDSVTTGAFKSLATEMMGTIPGHARLFINAQNCGFLLYCEIEMSALV